MDGIDCKHLHKVIMPKCKGSTEKKTAKKKKQAWPGQQTNGPGLRQQQQQQQQ